MLFGGGGLYCGKFFSDFFGCFLIQFFLVFFFLFLNLFLNQLKMFSIFHFFIEAFKCKVFQIIRCIIKPLFKNNTQTIFQGGTS